MGRESAGHMSTPTADVKLSAIAFLPIIRPGTISRCPRARYAVSWLSGFLATPLTRRMPLRVHAAYRADLAARNEEFLQQQVASFCILIGVACSALGGAVYAFFGELLVGAIWWAVTAILLGDWVLFKAGRIGWRGYVYAGCMPLPFAVSASVIALGGFNASCGVAIWGLVAPLIMRAMIGAKESLAMVGVYLANLAVSFVVPLYFPQTNSLPPRAQDFIFLFNLGASSSFVIVVLYYFIAQRDRLKERSEELLLNVLPALIAERLKRGETRIADTCTDVSIVFADIVGFTQLSSALPPGELVDLLNEVFSAFDELLGRYGIEKIKTIGDCYMAAVGVPTARSDHAEVAVRFALDIQKYADTYRYKGRALSFRIGIHSGAVVAGIIGQRKFSYDLWGNAVNTASRMESHGSAGCVQISEPTYRLVMDAFVCESRGIVDVKGKGAMPVWYVIDRR